MGRKKPGGAAMAAGRTLYMVELARGCSHIRSALDRSTLANAIVDVLDEFVRLKGDSELSLFQQLLAEELRRRGSEDVALAVEDVKPTAKN